MTDVVKLWTKSEKHQIVASAKEKGVYSVLGTKVGAAAMFDGGPYEGQLFKWSKKGIKSLAGTGQGGRIAKNHKPFVEEDSPFKIIGPAEEVEGQIILTVKVPEVLDELLQARASESEHEPLIYEVSIEANVTDVNVEDMTLDGGEITGISFTMDGHTSRCTIEDGCGVIRASLPSNISEEINMTEIDYKAKFEELQAEFDAFKEKVSASEAEDGQKELDALKAQYDSVVASYDEIKGKYDGVIASLKAKKLAELKAEIGEQAAKKYEAEGVTLCDIEGALEIVASFKSKLKDSEVVIADSGAPASASAPPAEDEVPQGDVLAFAKRVIGHTE